MKTTTIGIDLAKHLFQIHGVDGHGKVVLKRQLKRDLMLSFFTNLTPSLSGMDPAGPELNALKNAKMKRHW